MHSLDPGLMNSNPPSGLYLESLNILKQELSILLNRVSFFTYGPKCPGSELKARGRDFRACRVSFCSMEDLVDMIKMHRSFVG